ncbi:MAG: type III pantothenate kinase [Longimicrobiales bacterium]
MSGSLSRGGAGVANAFQLVADVGNTETVVGLLDLEGQDVRHHWRISTKVPRTRDEYGFLLKGLIDSAIPEGGALKRGVIGSVVPSQTTILEPVFGALATGPVYVVGAGSPLPIQLDVDEPLTVGADRIVNTLAAKVRFGRDTVAVDLGTATTYDCITAEGVFLGGVIAPGLSAGLDWLARSTAKLPKVELTPPDTVIGRRTEACIQSGVFFSVVDSVDGVVRRIKDEWGRPDALVVATGGFASVIGPHASTVDRIEPLLTLQGLGIAGAELERAGT